MLVSVLLACAGAVVLLVGWARQPKMALLYSRLDPEEAARIVEKIRDADVPYRLTDGGTTVYVPAEKVYSLRLTMAAQGLPTGEQAGYRILDEEKIGTSPFTQRVNYIRAVEGELARSIQIIEGVAAARVHVVRPEGSIFASRTKQASATVVLRLKGGYRLSPGNVPAIVHLVAGSLEGVSPKNVVVVDNLGNLLTGDADDDLARGAGTFLDYKSRVEQYLARKAEDMLTAVLGPNRASVRVNAVIDTARLSETVEAYDPTKRAVKREEIKSKSAVPAGAGRTGAGSTKEETTSTEYEVTRTLKQTTSLPGTIQSLSVAAFVDLTPTAQDNAGGESTPTGPKVTKEDVEEIIRNAIGLTGNDQLKVVDTPFSSASSPVGAEAEAEKPGMFTRQFILDIAQRVSLGLMVLGALLFLKMFGRKKTSPEAQAALEAGAGRENLLPSQETELDRELLRARITHALQENPEEVKRLFLTWAESE